MSGTTGDDCTMMARMRKHRQNGLAEMAGGMAHEINQPLGGIRGFAEGILIGLEEGWDISSAEIKEKMRRIIVEADRIDDLIQGMRSFADDEARLDIIDVDLSTVVKAAARLMGTRMQAHGVDWQTRTQGLPVRVRANPFALQEVVQILLSNASDACLERHGRNGGCVTTIIDGGVSPEDPVTLSIADNGSGMDATTLAKAGEPFFTTKGPDRGVGLGLAMARSILTQCGGQLGLTSAPGSGTNATIHLWHRAGNGAAS